MGREDWTATYMVAYQLLRQIALHGKGRQTLAEFIAALKGKP